MKIIDVRSKREYDQGHVRGAMWFDKERIVNGEMPDIPMDDETVLYCSSGNRSRTAMYAMRANGFTNVRNGGGLSDMALAGYELAG